MDKKAQKKISNKIRAKKIVDAMDVRMVKLNKYKVKQWLTDDEHLTLLNDLLQLHIKNYNNYYNIDDKQPLNVTIKDYLLLQILAIKEKEIDSLWLSHPEYWYSYETEDLNSNE